jgi:hypothetical protein
MSVKSNTKMERFVKTTMNDEETMVEKVLGSIAICAIMVMIWFI